MIVSLPAVAVNVTPANASVGSVATSGKFSTALAEATNGIGDTTVNPKAMGATGNIAAKGGVKSAAKSSSSSVHTSTPPDTQEPAASMVPDTSGKIFDSSSFPALSPLVPASAVSNVAETISHSTPVDDLKPVITSSTEVASVLPPGPAGSPPVSVLPQPSKATLNETNGPARTTRPEVTTAVWSTPSGGSQPIHAASADILKPSATNEIATIATPGEQGTAWSALAGKAEPVAAASTDLAFAVPPTTVGPPPISVAPQPSKATPNETNDPARTATPQVVAPLLSTPFGGGKVIDASSADTSKPNASNGIAPGGQGTRSTSTPVPSPLKATADTKLPAREGLRGTSTMETKPSTSSAIQEQRKSLADVAPIAVMSPASMPPGDIKLQAPQKAPVGEGTASKSEAAVASPSSETSRKDADADGNAASSFSNGDSSKSVGAPMSKPDGGDAAPETGSVSAANGVAVVQVSQPGIEGKAAAVASGASSQPTDRAARGLGQSPAGATDVEATADADASRIFSSLQAAKLVEKAGQTELRVGIPAGELGSVDIRTSMGRNQFTAEISVERAELGRALTAELPALHNRLAEQRVPPANIILQERSSGNSSGDLRQGPRYNPYSQSINLPGVGDAESVPLMAIEAMEDSRGLDIHV